MTIEALPALGLRWPNSGIPPGTCHSYPTSARHSGAIWDITKRLVWDVNMFCVLEQLVDSVVVAREGNVSLGESP